MTNTNDTPLTAAYIAAARAAKLALTAYIECECDSCQAHVRTGAAGYSVDYDHEMCQRYHASRAADEACDAAQAAWLDSDEPREWEFGLDGYWKRRGARRPSEVEESLRDWLEDGDWPTDEGTLWIDGRARALDPVTEEAIEDTDDVQVTVTIEPPAPECSADAHDWQSPHEVVGGIAENPGVFGKGGGVVITEVCSHCGRYRETDTWAQRPDTGEQGLRSVAYREQDEDSQAWIAARREEVA